MIRCPWLDLSKSDYVRYHDEEWGRPTADRRYLFEKLCLEGFQSGLSWLTILRKREGFRAAFAGFDFDKVALFGEDDIARCLADTGIVRHRGKIEGTIKSARALLELEAGEGFSPWIWGFVGGRPIQNRLASMAEAQAATEASTLMSKALKKKGFNFCGPTITYAFMQATGMVNDHLTSCAQHAECAALA